MMDAAYEKVWLLIKVSRLASWCFGPILYVIGILHAHALPKTLLGVLGFLAQIVSLSFPLSLVVFGVNDVHDYASDIRNTRKQRQSLEGGILEPVWVSLLASLDDDEAPDLPPHIIVNAMPARALRKTVLGGPRRRKTWDKSPNDVQPTHVVDLRLPHHPSGPSDSVARVDARLLPGGKYLLAENCATIQLLSVETREILWRTPSLSDSHVCLAFDFEMANGGGCLLVAAIFLETWVYRSYVRVFKFDFARRKSEMVIERDLPIAFTVKVAIRKDVVLVQRPHEFEIILVNWKTGESVFVDFSTSTRWSMDIHATFVKDQEIAVTLHAPIFCLILLSLLQLDGRWSRSSHFSDWEIVTYAPNASAARDVDGHVIQPESVLLLKKPEEVDRPWVLALHAFTPTWRGEDASPEIIIFAYGRADDQWHSFSKRLLAYKVQLTPATSAEGEDASPRLKLAAQACTPSDTVLWGPDCITNTGRMFTLGDSENLRVFSPFANTDYPYRSSDVGVHVQLDDEPATSAVEPYSGAVAVGTPGRVRILYFN